MKFLTKNIFTGEVFFAIFLFAGVFKMSLGISVDIAAIFLFLAVLSVIIRFMKNPAVKEYMIVPIALGGLVYAYLLISYMFSPSELYSAEKIIKFSLLSLPTIVLPILLIRSRESLSRFLVTIAAQAVIMSITAIPFILQRGSNISFIQFDGVTYQGLAILNGVGLSILLFYMLFNQSFKKYRLLIIISICLVTIVLLASGSRMPLIAFSTAMIYQLANSIKIQKGIIYMRRGTKLFLFLIAGTSFAVVFLANKGFFDTVIYRFTVLFTEESGGASAAGRLDRLKVAYEVFSANPIAGAGFGSFPLFYTGIDSADYPHNIIMEILAELGLLGLLIFLLYFFLALYRGLSVYKKTTDALNVDQIILFILLIYFILISFASGDINSNRALFVILSLLCVSPYINKVQGAQKNLRQTK